MQKNMQQFLTSVEIAPKGRIAINDLQSARIFSLNIYDSSYIPLYSYSLDGEVFVDDGSQFDEFANDGIYTFTPKEPNSPTGANLTVTFECNALDPKSETRKESFQAYIKDNNYLSLNNSRCIEPCTMIYRRLK